MHRHTPKSHVLPALHWSGLLQLPMHMFVAESHRAAPQRLAPEVAIEVHCGRHPRCVPLPAQKYPERHMDASVQSGAQNPYEEHVEPSGQPSGQIFVQ